MESFGIHCDMENNFEIHNLHILTMFQDWKIRKKVENDI